MQQSEFIVAGQGRIIVVAAVVCLQSLPDDFTEGTESENRVAIRSRIGKLHKVLGFNRLGHVELSWQSGRRSRWHTIWVEGKCLLVCDLIGRWKPRINGLDGENEAGIAAGHGFPVSQIAEW